MVEDEFDFTGKNLAELLPVDKKAVPFDYEARLHQRGYTETSPPDMGGLFQALATDYVPTRVIQLPPKIVTRVRIRDFLPNPSFWQLFIWLLQALFAITIYGCTIFLFGIIIPYVSLASFETRVNVRSSGACTVISTDIQRDEGDNGTYYETTVNFTLLTSAGKSYQTDDYWPSFFSQQSDAQRYVSAFRIHQTYQCWYNAANPIQASFYKQDVNFGDYLGLAFCVPLFLVVGVLPHLWLLRVLCRFMVNVIRGNTEIVW